MPDEVNDESNIDRLLKHLKDESLASRLIRAHEASDGGEPVASMKAVLTERLDEVKGKLNGDAN